MRGKIPDIQFNEFLVRKWVFPAFCRSSFAPPSLFLRFKAGADNIGFHENGVKQTCVFAAYRAGFRGIAGAKFARQ